MEIIIKGANFSALGFGNTRWIENYILSAGISSDTQKSALRALYSSYIAAGFTNKFAVFRLFFNTNPDVDKLNLISPYTTAESYAASWAVDDPAAHTLSGFQPSATTGRYAISTYKAPTGTTDFHMHVWNTTSEGSAAANRHMMGVAGGTTTFSLQRNRSGVTAGSVGNTFAAGSVSMTSAYDVTKTGLLSFSRTGTVHNLYDAGAVINTVTKTADALNATTLNFYEGYATGTTQPAITDAKIFFIAYGASAWTAADEVALKNMITAFKSAIGA